MKMKRDPRIGSGAFTGPFCVVGNVSGLAIQSENTEDRALRACEWLNEHNKQHGHRERYSVVNEDRAEAQKE